MFRPARAWGHAPHRNDPSADPAAGDAYRSRPSRGSRRCRGGVGVGGLLQAERPRPADRGSRLDRAPARRRGHPADAAAQSRPRGDGDRDRGTALPGACDLRVRTRGARLDGTGRRTGRLTVDAHARIRAGAASAARRRGGDDGGPLRAPRPREARLAARAHCAGARGRRGPEDAVSHGRGRRRHRPHRGIQPRHGALRRRTHPRRP